MYEQVSHSLLNEILDNLKPEIKSKKNKDLRYFYTRLGANFYAIYSLFYLLYGNRNDFKKQMLRLVETLAKQYIERPDILRQTDIEREEDHNWFLSQNWVGMALYSNGFADDLKDLQTKIPYFQELGVNLVHIMPILKCPEGNSDGGYAISDFREVDPRAGSLQDLQGIAVELKKRDILLTLDVVVNHTSDEHQWAQKAIEGDKTYQDYFYIYETREIPDMFEQTMPEIFPGTAPGNFTWHNTMEKWVMTCFNVYQWDLNYSNPAVFINMVDIILYWANQGADIIRLDAVAFLWKKIGTNCQNQREAHLILQLMKDCCQVTAPGVLFIAEAIVAPVEVIKYFGEDAINAKECEIAYNATFMALLWEALATKNAKLLNQGIQSLPDKLERATWLNYIRCHDDIGLGFDDNDIVAVDYNPYAHRQFLIDFYTGEYADSTANGVAFMRNEKNGDARISGSLASLAGLEKAIQNDNQDEIQTAIEKILLLHSLILSFGGIPLLYYGDEIGMLNDCSYLEDEIRANDNRWIHRPKIDWEKANLRNKPGTIEFQIFEPLKKMITLRKETGAFADFNNRELIPSENIHLFAFIRHSHQYQGLDLQAQQTANQVLVINNFDANPQLFDLNDISKTSLAHCEIWIDLYSAKQVKVIDNCLILQPFQFLWLTAY